MVELLSDLKLDDGSPDEIDKAHNDDIDAFMEKLGELTIEKEEPPQK